MQQICAGDDRENHHGCDQAEGDEIHGKCRNAKDHPAITRPAAGAPFQPDERGQHQHRPKIKLFLQKSDKASAVRTSFGNSVPETMQISFSFGTTNTNEPTQTTSAGKIRATTSNKLPNAVRDFGSGCSLSWPVGSWECQRRRKGIV